ncbi:redoxin domain-containing protein [Gracilibacillus sp. YIM 98692]|uniref:redoxin domain-containing protein n=1 Tax=Gracilibacillus sp. YIM 98692 TaxID=2663532 RepID=UPI0013D615FF|nr:redoxin domain-containing protein [Gracilibacillus sp. YIM 98692]
MKKNILGISIIAVLVAIFLIDQFYTPKQEDTGPNEVDVTGDPSISGEALTAPNQKLLQEGDKAPPFQLVNLQGDKATWDDFDTSVVVLNFWATWCKPCMEEMPDLATLHNEYGEEAQVVAVNVTDTETSEEKVHQFVQDGSFPFAILLDKEASMYDSYSIINIPTTFFIRSEDQEIIKRVNGFMTYEQMEEYTQSALDDMNE